ncbi:maleylpyruvate isomerase N-terminal domain-containing protein [Dactylosporangium sp. NBC_01737]|uniref:maleylpyruvate isomerase N-terminal domain-containing protein n=1 Tax=Dactylosporangium sp. NBC_01737 TaxID=2975959 RepID=UPI002E0F8CFA|nr:maleylpyruvate isomerase N-terminal domain-containing protein [Dactylosporangium sp. NBC_01737]
MIRSAFLDSAQSAAALLREPAVAARWSTPSTLPGFSVGGLARHLANQVTRTVTALAAPPGTSAIPVMDHFTGAGWVNSGADSADNTAILERSETAAAQTTAADLAAEVDAALAELSTMVPAQHAERVVDLGRWGLLVDDFLLTRVLELVVHTDDLAVSLDLPTPDLPAAATGATIDLLGRLAAWRHGPLPVVRALARRERAPDSIAAL